MKWTRQGPAFKPARVGRPKGRPLPFPGARAYHGRLDCGLFSSFCGGTMQYRIVVRAALGLCLATALTALVSPIRQSVSAAATLTPGRAELKSAGPLAFGPDGVLFVGDSVGGAVVALDTADRTPVRTA